MRCVPRLIGVFILGSCFWAGAEDWPSYLHDMARSGVSREKLTLPLHPQWTYQAKHAPCPAWPAPAKRDIWHEIRELSPVVTYDRAFHAVIAEGQLCFASSADDQVCCVDAATGDLKWRFLAEAPVRLAPSLAAGKVYFGADDGWIYCLKASDGAVVWKQRPAPDDRRYPGNGRLVSSTPVRSGVIVDQGVAYVFAGLFPDEGVYCCALDAETGAIRWTQKQEDLSPQGYPLASATRLFVPTGRTSPMMFDRVSGNALGQLAGGGGAYAILVDDAVVSGPGVKAGQELTFADAATKEGVARCEGTHMVVDGPMAYIHSKEDIKALDRPKYLALSAVWNQRNAERAALDKQRDAAKGKLDTAEVNRLSALIKPIEAAMDEVQKQMDACYLWKKASDCPYALILAGDLLIAGGDGKIEAFGTRDGAGAWRAELPGRVYGLSAANGRLYASTDRGAVHCFAAQAMDAPRVIAEAAQEQPYPQDEFSGLCRDTAEAIATLAGADQGYCVIVGSGEGQLAHAICQRTRLKVVGLERDPAKMALAREKLSAAGLYGPRVAILPWDGEKLPLSTYSANVIASEEALLTGKAPIPVAEARRVLRPYGGAAILGHPKGAMPRESLAAWLGESADGQVVESKGIWAVLRRGAVPGAGEWTQLYADSGHTACSMDEVKGPMQVLWFGEPGPRDIVDRHHRPMASLFKNGRLFVPGDDVVMAVDPYNGTPLWRLEAPNMRRVGVMKNAGQMLITDDVLYLAVKDECWGIDPKDGSRLFTFKAPKLGDRTSDWGYLDCVGDTLIATFQTPGASFNELSLKTVNTLEGDYRPVIMSDGIFCIDRHTGKEHWRRQKGGILNDTIAIADGRVFALECRNPEVKKDSDGRVVIRNFLEKDAHLLALNLKNGRKAWDQPVQFPFHHILYLNGAEGVLLASGSYNEKSEVYYAIFAYDMRTGKPLWNAPFRALDNRSVDVAATGGSHGEQWQHPVIIGDSAYLRPFAFNLHSGEKKEYKLERGGHGCGGLTGSAYYLYGRGSNPRMYPVDVPATDGVRLTRVSRPGCWLNIIPAGGIIMIPESSSGCTCAYPVQTSFAFIPRDTL